jgi:hypothetical protein
VVALRKSRSERVITLDAVIGKINPKYFGYVLLAFAYIRGVQSYSLVVADGGAGYQTGDWLINYNAGFIRRGLFGSLFLFLTPSTNWTIWILFAIQAMLYTIIFCFFFHQLHVRNPNWTITLLICSPANICFSGWDPAAFGRKEIIGYCALVFLFAFSNIAKFRNRKSVLSASILFFILGVFSWEPTALMLPAFLILIHKSDNLEFLLKKHLYLAYTFIAVTGLSLSTYFHGNENSVSTICNLVRRHQLTGELLCSGGISAIGWSLDTTLTKVLQSFPLYSMYLPYFLVSIGPYLILGFTRKNKVAFYLTVISVLPLFFLVNDYGRWISIISILVLIQALVDFKNNEDIPHISPILVLAYISLWGLPHFVEAGSRWPIHGFVPSILKMLIEFFI